MHSARGFLQVTCKKSHSPVLRCLCRRFDIYLIISVIVHVCTYAIDWSSGNLKRKVYPQGLACNTWLLDHVAILFLGNAVTCNYGTTLLLLKVVVTVT